MRGTVVVIALALTASLTPAAARADHGGATIPWTSLLPAQWGAGQAGRNPTGCGADGLPCVRHVERRLARLAERFGCDHRGVFATTYLLLTRELRAELERRPAVFDDPAAIGQLAAVFFDMYRNALAAHEAGEPLPAAWAAALDTAREGDHNAGQDMLLSISAHVQHDMPFAIAAVGLRMPDGRSRKPDHDRVNVVLSRAYDRIVPAVAERYDPFMSTADAKPSPVDDLAAQNMVAGWRENVWRNAERLTTARSQLQRQAARQFIERNAEGWARGIAAFQTPGYRATRDAHCARASA